MSPSTWAHPLFHRDHPHLAQQITRKATPAKSRLRKDRGEKDMRKQLEKEQKALAAAKNEVTRLEAELAEAQQQASMENNLLLSLEQQAVNHVVAIADRPLEEYNNVKAQDFGLNEQDLIDMDELDVDSETEETEAADEAETGRDDAERSDECEALAAEMVKSCKLFGYNCPIANAKDQELYAQSKCAETRRELESYVEQIQHAKQHGLPPPPTPPFLLKHQKERQGGGNRSPHSVMAETHGEDKCAIQ